MLIYDCNYEILYCEDIMVNFYRTCRIAVFLCLGLPFVVQLCVAGATPLTPPANKKRAVSSISQEGEDGGQLAISPQAALLPVTNMAREVLEMLATGLNGAGEDALKPFAAWYLKFPTLFNKIRWSTPDDERDKLQNDFKYKLAGALHHCILSCLSQSCTPIISMPKNDLGTEKCTSSIDLGRYVIRSQIATNTLRPKHFITLVDNNKPMPTYNGNNRIKKTFMDYLFKPDDTQEFQAVLQELLSAIPEELREAKEQFYHALVYGMLSFMGSSFSIVEAYSGKGRADLLLVSDIGKATGTQNCIIEFKYGKNVQDALQQIESQNYCAYFNADKNVTVQAVGINIRGKSAKKSFQVTCAKKMITVSAPTITAKNGTSSIALPAWK